jgi:hypothetical protein
MWRFVIVLLLAATALHGQQPLAPGMRVRVTAPNVHRPVAIGNLVRIIGDTATIVDTSGSITTLVLGSDRRLDLSLGRHRRVGRSARTGFLMGAVAGAALGAATWAPCPPDAFLCFQPENRGQAAVLGGVVLGVPGLLVGALVGTAKSERWERVRSHTDVALFVRPSDAHIGLRMAF